MTAPSELRACSREELAQLVKRFHGYGTLGSALTYAFAVYEDDVLVAAYGWQPPPPGAARAVCPEEPSAVLALTRMVAVPKEQRVLKHISKPLREQMKHLIDRSRWPVLITYSDEGQGHTGYVYQCSGFEKTARREAPFFIDETGARLSSYANGKHGKRGLLRGGTTYLQRWEHWACLKGEADRHLRSACWVREGPLISSSCPPTGCLSLNPRSLYDPMAGYRERA